MGPPPPSVVLVSGPDSLAGLEPLLLRAGLRIRRILALRFEPLPRSRLRARLERFADPEVVIATSRFGARLLGPLVTERGPLHGSEEGWAAGRESAAEMRRSGFRRVRRPAQDGARGILRALGDGPVRRIVAVRSDLAGPDLPRELRGQGHAVLDLLGYRVRPGPRLSAGARAAVARASVVVITSPSALDALGLRLGPLALREVTTRTPLVVLGPRTGRAARRLGARNVRVSGSASAAAVARAIVRQLRGPPPRRSPAWPRGRRARGRSLCQFP